MLSKFFSIVFLLFCFSALAQPSIDSLKLQQDIVKMLSIDSLQRSGGAVTSLIGFSEHDIRETPGDIFILNAEDLEAMNAISLMDVLIQMAPTSLGRDVEDAIGLGVRGLWAQEGKILFMFNGIPLNDLDYGTYLLGGRISLHMVSRIEFNFGPGSVKYGGTAALGVINIVLKNHAEFSGGSIDAGLGFSNGKFDRQNIGFVGNYELNDHYQMTIQVNSNKIKKSTRIQEIGRNRFINWADSSNSNCNNVFIGLRKGKYRGSFYFSDYQAQISDEPQLILMSTLGFDNSIQFKVSEKTKLEAQLIYLDQLPWVDLNTTDSSLLNSNTHAQRLSQNLVFKSRFGKNFNIDYGLQGNWQQSKILLRSARFTYNDLNLIRVGSGAVFFDGYYKGKLGSLSIGSRMESHTFSKLLFAPRLGYSFQFQHFYIKTFFAQSFKIATIQNQNGSIDETSLNHETVTTGEFELGWNYKNVFLKLNAFKTKVFDPILYVYDPELSIDNYINRSLIGTEGVQFYANYSSTKWSFGSSAMYNRTIDHELIPELQSLKGAMYFGFPMYKYHFHSSYRIMKMFNINFGLTKQGAIQSSNNDPFQNGLLLQAGINGRVLNNKNLYFSLALRNILNSDFYIVSPIDADLEPLPLLSRQFQVSIQYLFY